MAEIFIAIIIGFAALSLGAFGQALKHGRDCERLDCTKDHHHD